MSLDILNKLGLSQGEIQVYETLLNQGELSVGEISKLTNLKRGDAYNKLYSLKKMGLIEQREKINKITFFPLAPNQLLNLTNIKINALQESQSTLLTLLPNLMVHYSSLSEKPVITAYEGKQGLKQVYSLLNTSGAKTLYLIRSAEDHLRPEIGKIVDAQIKKQVKLDIATKALTPLVPETKQTYFTQDKLNLVERRIIPPQTLELPVQIMIWKESIAISTFRKALVCTVINHKLISLSFKQIFNFIWESVNPFHQQVVRDWQNDVVDFE